MIMGKITDNSPETGNLEHNLWLLGEVSVQCDQLLVSVEDHSGFGLDQIVS